MPKVKMTPMFDDVRDNDPLAELRAESRRVVRVINALQVLRDETLLTNDDVRRLAGHVIVHVTP